MTLSLFRNLGLDMLNPEATPRSSASKYSKMIEEIQLRNS